MLNNRKDITEDKERIDKISKISFDKLYTHNHKVKIENKNESFTDFNQDKFSKRVRKQSGKPQEFSLIDI